MMTADTKPRAVPAGDVLLSVQNLKISVPTDEGRAAILDHVALDVPAGKIIGVAGESGCGKSTLIRAILGILPHQTIIDNGQILFKGENLLAMPKSDLRTRIRGRAIGFIPQDPYLALNPVFRVGTQLLEILRAHGTHDQEPGQRYSRALRKSHTAHLVNILRAVKLPDPEAALERYPHEFSGGQRQRLLIAGALLCRPDLILADEPTTALDVTTQLQILRLLKDLVEDFEVSMVFVTHDFGVIAQICDSVSVMYAGQTVETGDTKAIIDAPQHPYTQMLMGCHPDRSTGFEGIPGQVPSPIDPPPGCRFNPRCPSMLAGCMVRRPDLKTDPNTGHSVACILHETLVSP